MTSAKRDAKRVTFHRVSAYVWMALLIPSALLWRDSVFWVICISIYANVKSDFAASAASDDTKVLEALAELKEMLRP